MKWKNMHGHKMILRPFLELTNGMPSHDTYKCIFTIDSEEIKGYLLEWISTLAQLKPKEVVAIDRNTLRGSKADRKIFSTHG